MRSKFKWIFTLLLAFSMQFSFAQEKTVSGTVTESGLPLPGVSVVVKGTTVGTQTDFNGKYSIQVAQGQTLEFSYVGFKTQAVVVGAASTVNTVMVEDATSLDEVLVVGFYTQKKEDITSSVVNVGAKDMEKMSAVTTLDNMLQGKAAGVQVVANSGRPGQAANVRIRGINGISGAADPLYVVDGVYMTPTQMVAINPADVENQTILKDAAATALYGSRGANGVIIITTKRAKAGRTQFQLNTSFGTSERVDDNFDVMNAAQFLAHEKKLIAAGVNGIPNRTDEQIAALTRNGANWEDEIFRKGQIQSVQFSAQSSTETTNFSASFSHDKNSGLINPWKGFDKTTGRIKVDQKLKHGITFGGNIGMSYTKDDRPREAFNVLSPVFAAYGSTPLIGKYQKDADGQLVLDNFGNPIYNKAGLPNNLSYFDIYDNYSIETRQFRTFGGVYGLVDDLFIKGLSFKSEFTAAYTRHVAETFVVPGSDISFAFGSDDLGDKTDNGSDALDYRWVNTLRYNKTFNDKHSIDAMVFSEYNKFNSYTYSLTSQGFPNSFLQVQSVAGTPTAATTDRSDYLFLGYGANLLYDYDGKYFVQASVKREGASMFGRQDNIGYFPGVSAGWKISGEEFMKNVTFVDLLKLRGSWGQRGSQDGIGQTYPLTSVAFPSYNNTPGGAPSASISNPFLQWAKSETKGLGLDFELFKRRLTGTVEYFTDNRTNFYFSDNLPIEAGGYTQSINAGEFVNRGWEFTLAYDIFNTADFSWSINGNLTLVKSEVKDLYNQPQVFAGGTTSVVGGMINEYFDVRYAGVNPANGEPLYYDKEGQVTNVYDADNAVALKDKTPAPTFYGGFGTSVRYKSLDFSADFTYQGGNYIFNVAELVLLDPSNTNQNFRTDAGNFWTTPGQTNVLPSPVNPDGTTRTYQSSDQFLQKGDYVRLRSVNLGYTFDKKVFGENSFMERARVYVQAQNIFTWTNFKGDPEVGAIGLETAGLSGEAYRWAYPNAQILSFGVQLTF